MFSNSPGASVMITGGIFTNVTQTKRGFDLLMERAAFGAMHNSDELYDVPKCHPNTRVAVLDDLMKWVNESEAQDDFILWLFGAAGAGKSAIAKKLAELAAEKGLLIGTFFFSRTSSPRNVKDRLIPTLAYQMALSIPDTRTYIEAAIERDPAIFEKALQIQIDTLLIQPFQSVPTQITPFPKLIIIDGLDECNNSKSQVAILDAISRSFSTHKLPIIFLVASRPEPDIAASFKGNEPLQSIHRPLSLNDTYHAYDDIRLFFSDKFKHIQCTHLLKSTIPIGWPTEEALEKLVKKSSGQFIYAATVVRFVESNRHRPVERLNTILGISPPGTMNPFAELDVLYKQILSSVDDIQLTLHVLSLYTAAPNLVELKLRRTRASDMYSFYMSAEQFLSLEEGDIELALIDLSSIVSYNESSGRVKILHASFVDFLADRRRSNEFYIDVASTGTDFICRTLQYIKGPDGIRAGDYDLLRALMYPGPSPLRIPWILNELRNNILDFDFDAFITAVIKRRYKSPDPFRGHVVFFSFCMWDDFLRRTGLQDQDEREVRYRFKSSFESRVQKYHQSDWRLQLLLPIAAASASVYTKHEGYRILLCRYLDILLEMDNHDLHLVDRDILDLRHSDGLFKFLPKLFRMTFLVDGDRYASAALHCMRFLYNPPKYSESNSPSPNLGLIYSEWKATCDMALDILSTLLDQANTSSELVQFMINHDIDSSIREAFSSVRVWRVDVHILAFLGRASVCVNWRILATIQLAAFGADVDEDVKMDNRWAEDRIDQCCIYAHHAHFSSDADIESDDE